MPQGVPAPARLLAALSAVGLGAWFGLLQGYGFWLSGCPATSLAVAFAVAPPVLFLGAVAIAPDALDPLLRRRTRIDLTDGGQVAAVILLVATLFYVLAWAGLVTATATVESAIGGCDLPEAGAIAGGDIVEAVLINLAVFTIPVLLYVSFVHGVGPTGAARLLGLRAEGAQRALAMGVLAAVGFIGLMVVFTAFVAPSVPEGVLENEKALEIARSLTIPGAIAVALASGIGEEIFFRGFLQQRIGILATTVFFSLAHFSYGSISEVVVVALLSIAMGFLFKRTGNLYAPIATHVAFNLLNLLAAMYVPEAG